MCIFLGHPKKPAYISLSASHRGCPRPSQLEILYAHFMSSFVVVVWSKPRAKGTDVGHKVCSLYRA